MGKKIYIFMYAPVTDIARFTCNARIWVSVGPVYRCSPLTPYPSNVDQLRQTTFTGVRLLMSKDRSLLSCLRTSVPSCHQTYVGARRIKYQAPCNPVRPMVASAAPNTKQAPCIIVLCHSPNYPDVRSYLTGQQLCVRPGQQQSLPWTV